MLFGFLAAGYSCSCHLLSHPVQPAASLIAQSDMQPPSLEYIEMYKDYCARYGTQPLNTEELEAALSQDPIPVKQLSQLIVILSSLRSYLSADTALTQAYTERHVLLIDVLLQTLSNYLN